MKNEKLKDILSNSKNIKVFAIYSPIRLILSQSMIKNKKYLTIILSGYILTLAMMH